MEPLRYTRVELLAPARDYEAAVAAVEYGADAIYIGASRFGARQAAGNSVAEIARAAEYAHRFGVRVHATLNTLLRDDELEAAEREARALIAAGVDALIVQDMALRRMALPVELHASTQCATRTVEEARFLGRAGFARVILERALSLDEIRAICRATDAEVECFVHGAICVGYSGRCFLSRSLSDRSGNRGACAQPCRLTWDLTDGSGRSWMTGRHLLSLRDMNFSRRVGDLLDAGVRSLKIEGRLKDTLYVRNITAYYRRVVDEALGERPQLVRSSVGESRPDFEPDPAKSFTRGDSEYYLDGRRRGVASFDTPKSIGERVGRIAAVGAGRFRMEGTATLAPGDGLCIRGPKGAAGTGIRAVDGEWVTPNRMEGVAVGAELYRNSDVRFNRLLAASRTRRTIAARGEAACSAEGIVLRYTDCQGVHAEARRCVALEAAKNPEANAAALRAQMMRSGDTIFAVNEAEVTGSEWFAPASLVAELRREALGLLAEARAALPREHRILDEDPAARYPSERMGADGNVTNRLAEAFYRDHGVRTIDPPLETAPSTRGRVVMRSAYCIRREIGECLRGRHRLEGDLYIERGRHRYRLLFDCARCEMALEDRSERDGQAAEGKEKNRRDKK